MSLDALTDAFSSQLSAGGIVQCNDGTLQIIEEVFEFLLID